PLQLIRTAGCKTGLAFNPATPLEVLEYVIDKVDLVLVMSVNPGFGGQSFLDAALLKLERARRLIGASGREIRLEVDGGIKIGNIQRTAAAGADTFVAGSAIFGCADYQAVIEALLVIDRLRMNLGLEAQAPSLHMSFTGNPGTGKTTVALRMAQILNRLGYVRKGHLVAVTRDDLVGQYIGHTAPKTREVLKRAMGGVLFIDEAYYLYRPENERDYGQEAIEILLQVMENQRDDLVVILAGYKERMDTFFRSNPGMSSRIAHHLDFPDYAPAELLRIADKLLEQHNYRFAPGARATFEEYLTARIRQPNFANARSVRNALDRARL